MEKAQSSSGGAEMKKRKKMMKMKKMKKNEKEMKKKYQLVLNVLWISLRQRENWKV